LTAKLLDRNRTQPPLGAIEFNDVAVRSLAIMFGLWLVAAQVLVRNVDSAAHFGGGLLGLIIGAGLAWRHNGPRARAAGLP
jgi:membrane associated rhomboid family serine protease